MERIEELIKLYTGAARNLRRVAELADDQEADSNVAATSRAKANTYDLVISDLKMILENGGK